MAQDAPSEARWHSGAAHVSRGDGCLSARPTRFDWLRCYFCGKPWSSPGPRAIQVPSGILDRRHKWGQNRSCSTTQDDVGDVVKRGRFVVHDDHRGAVPAGDLWEPCRRCHL